MGNWYQSVIHRYNLANDWDLTARDREAILSDFLATCPDDVDSIWADVALEPITGLMVSDPLEFAKRARELFWEQIEQGLENALTDYDPREWQDNPHYEED